MPRPRVARSRVNRGGPQRVTRAKVATITRQEIQQKLANKQVGDTLSNSDDSDDLVVARPGQRNRRQVPRREVYASGGLGKGDTPQAHKKYQIAKRKADEIKYGSATPPASRSQTNGSRTASATSSPHTLSKPSPPKSILKSPSIPPQPASVARPISMSYQSQITPGTGKASFADLKPRKRQASLLAGLRQDATTLEDTEMNVSGLDEFDDILPNDESTPLNSVRANRISLTTSSTSQTPSSTSSRKRKVSSEIIAERPAKRLSNGSTTSLLQLTSEHDEESSLSRSRSVPSKSPSLPPIRTPRPQDDYDEIYAPPKSSSPVKPRAPSFEDSGEAPEAARISKSTRRKTKLDQSKMTTEALQALLPTRRQHKKSAEEFDIPSDPTNEDESSFLPTQRTRKSKSSKETRTASSRGGKAGKGKGGSKPAPIKERNNGKVRKGPAPNKTTPLKDASTRSAAKTSQQQEKAKVTYSSRRLGISAADKENQPFDTFDESSSPTNTGESGFDSLAHTTVTAKEAAREKKKWADIDAFSLDFEEVSSENLGGSSPMRV